MLAFSEVVPRSEAGFPSLLDAPPGDMGTEWIPVTSANLTAMDLAPSASGSLAIEQGEYPSAVRASRRRSPTAGCALPSLALARTGRGPVPVIRVQGVEGGSTEAESSSADHGFGTANHVEGRDGCPGQDRSRLGREEVSQPSHVTPGCASMAPLLPPKRTQHLGLRALAAGVRPPALEARGPGLPGSANRDSAPAPRPRDAASAGRPLRGVRDSA